MYLHNRHLTLICSIGGILLFFVILVGCEFTWPLHNFTSVEIPSLTRTLTVVAGRARTWPPPAEKPVTPVPDPMTGISVHQEVESIVILGLDRDFPFSGRTDAMYLILYNRRTSMASIISIPPDLFVYLPGHTMQRINSAYPVGGITLVNDTLEYNLSLKPDHYFLVQFNEFKQIVDAVGGIDVVVVGDLSDPCSLSPGKIHMNGDQAFCYAIYRRGEDDIDRNRRQLQVMRAFFLRLFVDGEIVHLPELYDTFKATVKSDLTLNDLLVNIPLAIQLVDPQRVAYFQISWDEVTQWLVPGRAKTIVLLPNHDTLLDLIRDAVAFIMTPAPYTDLATTIQYRLTQTIEPPFPFTFTPTILTGTPLPFTITPTGTATETPTPTLEGYP